jgi:hypothetical protein
LNVGKTLVTVVIVLLVFGTLISFLPIEFRLDFTGQEPLVVEKLSAADLMVYANTGTDTMIFPYESTDTNKWTMGLPDNEYVQIAWKTRPFPTPTSVSIWHVKEYWAGISIVDLIIVQNSYGIDVTRNGITRSEMVDAWVEDIGASIFTASCSHVSLSIMFEPPEGYSTIGDAWDAGVINYYFTYEWDEEASGHAVVNLIVRLLTFQGIGVGIPGIIGGLVDSLISALLYIAIGWVAYKLIVGLIPFVSGGSGT